MTSDAPESLPADVPAETDAADLTLHAGRTRRQTTPVSAKLDGRTVHADTLNLTRAADRRRFAADLVELCPALDAAAVDEELLRLRDDLTAGGGSPADPAPPVQDPTDPTHPTGHGDAAAEDERVVIVLGTAEWKANEQAVAALANAPDLFKMGDALVRVIRAGDAEPGEVPGGRRIARPDESPAVAALKPAHTRDTLTRVAAFFNVKDDGEERRAVPAHPPGWLVGAVHLAGEFPGVRPLDGIAAGPVLRPDGTVLHIPGYDPHTRLYVPPAAVAGVPAVPDQPTPADVAAAVELLTDVVCDFPFLNDAHRAAWAAAVLTVIARPAFDGPTPLFLIDANTPSAGKTLLADVTLLIALGRPPAVMGSGGSDEEMDKRITALAMAGDPVVQLDNIGAGDTLGGPALDRALTADVWSGRVLGESRIYTGPLRAVWFATGNNTALSADTPRRVVPIRLECPHERPEDRTPAEFRYADLKGYAATNRGPLLAAGLTWLRGYFTAGRPAPPGGRRVLGSFEEWSRLVRDAVVWAGLPDPLDARSVLADAADPAADALPGALHGLRAMTGGEGLPASAILSRVAENPAAHADLRDALQALCDCRPGTLPDPTTLGKKLATVRGRVCGGLALHRQSGGGGVMKWSVRPAPGAVAPSPSGNGVGGVSGVTDAPPHDPFADDLPDGTF
ncbi:hypothetical protein [Alienimonas californiensis]|uniref:Uncharacterized protein n=1 Tax=Alienimonas californiensis TaxID=2527989 RepID=A0A517P8M3_9PLAN|nr:hypothetical protein [Alienimonas californiensis]QDT15729.1 hypothetical protein CA12_18210 [Alienimonas californiensis]